MISALLGRSPARVAGALAIALCAGSASAATVFFSDRAAFDAARGSAAILESFEAPRGAAASQSFGSFTMTESGGVNAIGIGDSTFASSFGVSNGITDGARLAVFDDNDSSLLTFQFGEAVTAFGVDVTTNEATTMTVGGDVSTSFTTAVNAPRFFGIINTSAPFDTISFAASGGPYVAFDAVSADAVAPVPLPAAAWGGMALMGLIGAKRLRRKGADE